MEDFDFFCDLKELHFCQKMQEALIFNYKTICKNSLKGKFPPAVN